MGIRTDSDLQQISVEDGHNPYTAEDLAVYSPAHIDQMTQHNDEIFRLFDETKGVISDISLTIERLGETLQTVCDNVERIEKEFENN